MTRISVGLFNFENGGRSGDGSFTAPETTSGKRYR